MEEFRNLDRDIEGSAKRWKKLVESEAPEKEKLPQEWKNKNALQKLCIMRALRADRMTYAVRWAESWLCWCKKRRQTLSPHSSCFHDCRNCSFYRLGISIFVLFLSCSYFFRLPQLNNYHRKYTFSANRFY